LSCRAAFYLTHEVDVDGFDFVAYSCAAMEGDYAAITGVGPDSWAVVVAFMAASTWIGVWPA
jgi:hypothetical protein